MFTPLVKEYFDEINNGKMTKTYNNDKLMTLLI